MYESKARATCQQGGGLDSHDVDSPQSVSRQSDPLAVMADREPRIEDTDRHLQQQIRQIQRVQSLGLLARALAHDLNNHLMSVVAHTDLALLELPEDTPARQDLDGIMQSCRNAADLCRQTLDYYGPGDGSQAFDLSETMRRMSLLLKATCGKKVELEQHLEARLPRVRGDAFLVQQAVLALVANAAESFAGERGTVRLTTGAAHYERQDLARCRIGRDLAPGTYAYCRIVDGGSGIAAADVPRLFDPFFSTKGAGRGFGLAAVRQIVVELGGALEIRSQPQEGTHVVLLMPVESQAAVQPPQPLSAAAGSKTGKILVVDDEATVRMVTGRMCERMGFEALTAADGIEGVELFTEHAQDIFLVLLDFSMPRMEGDEALRRMRQIREDVHVVIISGCSPHEVRARIPDLEQFLQKPLHMKDLQAVIEASLRAV